MKSRAAIYCRLSVEDRDKEGGESESILNQKLILTEYAKGQGFEIVAAYSEECDILTFKQIYRREAAVFYILYS